MMTSSLIARTEQERARRAAHLVEEGKACLAFLFFIAVIVTIFTALAAQKGF